MTKSVFENQHNEIQITCVKKMTEICEKGGILPFHAELLNKLEAYMDQ